MRDNSERNVRGWFGSPHSTLTHEGGGFLFSPSPLGETTAGRGRGLARRNESTLRAVMRKNRLSNPTLSSPEPDFGHGFGDDDPRITDDRNCFEFDWQLRLPFLQWGLRKGRQC
jgi:hypothetical protein